MAFLHTFTLILILKCLNVASQSSYYCIWGETGANYININGQYIFDGIINGKSSYLKVIGSTCLKPVLYLWRNNAVNAWQISIASGTQTGSYIIQCSKSSLSQCTAGNWGRSNPDVYAIPGSCPKWECASVSTAQTYRNCDGPFDQYLGDNKWKHHSLNLYLYFVPHAFHWACYSELTTTECPVYAYTATYAGWVDLSAGQSTSLTFQWLGTSSTLTSSFQVNCLGDATNMPASNPTKKPTPAPTNKPVGVSTSKPTPAPTIKPAIPTKHPVHIPSTTNAVSSTQPKQPTASIQHTTPTKIPNTFTETSILNPPDTTLLQHDDGQNDANEDLSPTFVFIGIGIGLLLCVLCCCAIAILYKIMTRELKQAKDGVGSESDFEDTEMITYGLGSSSDQKKEVMLWLKGIGLSQYYPMFMRNGFETMESIGYIDSIQTLDNIGITRAGHKLKIWSHIRTGHGEGPGYDFSSSMTTTTRTNMGHSLDIITIKA
eukprot:28389_1